MKDTVISLSNIGVAFDGREVISKLNWHVERGENWAIIGPNGAGKTTLLRVINGYQWPSMGKIKILGKPFGSIDLRELRKEIGMVSSYLSDWIPSDEKVLNIVISGKYASIRLWIKPTEGDVQYAQSLLRSVGCFEYQEKKFGNLSQGERQKILITRALMARPRLLTLDEPCAGLDLQARESFLSELEKIAKKSNPTLIYVAHRIDEIPKGFTHALLLKRGRVVASGTIGEVLTSANLSNCFDVKIRVKKWRGRFYTLIDHDVTSYSGPLA